MNRGIRAFLIAGTVALFVACLLIMESTSLREVDSTTPKLRANATRPPTRNRETQRTQDHRTTTPRPTEVVEPTLRGTVRFADGTPAKAIVYALLESGVFLQKQALKGSYEFRQVRGESAVLWCQVEGHPQLIEDIRLTRDRVQTFDFELPPLRRVAVRVEVPDGAPVQLHPGFRALRPPPITALHVVATRAPPASPLPLCAEGIHATYDVGRFVSMFSNGAVSTPHGCLGVLLLAGEPSHISLVHGHDVIETREPTTSEEVVFQLERKQLKALTTRLSFLVRSHVTGEECRGAQARLDLGTSRGDWHRVDDDGTINISAPATGLYTLIVEGRGYASVEKLVHLTAAKPTHLGTLELHPAVTIAGRIVREGEQPASGTLYCLDPASGDLPVLRQRRRFPVTEHGKFRIPDAPPGRVDLVIATHAGLRAGVTVDASAGSVDDCVVTLPVGHPVILEAAGEGFTQRLCTLLDADDRPLWSDKLKGGQLVVLHLPAGRYVAQLRDHALDPVVRSSTTFDVDGRNPWVTIPTR